MPTITLEKDEFYARLGKSYSTEDFDELLFAYGLELDEDTSQSAPNELPHKLKVEIPANRYDLLCMEGLVRALRIYLGWETRPEYRLLPWQEDGITVKVSKSVERIRPFFAGAVLRGVKFTPQSYASFIDLQDKLHMNLARKRTLVAIGTHDLSKIAKGPISYEALPPKDIKFQPLNKDQAYTAEEMMTLYETDRHLNKFLPIIRDSPVYPIIYDTTRQVLSMPPIINSEHTKITLDTQDIFVDTTATDETKLSIVINMVVTMFSQYTSEPFCIEPVKVIYESGATQITPDLSTRSMKVSASYINAFTALQLTSEQVCDLLDKMGNRAVVETDDSITLHISPTRPDILHPCDVVEDAAIAYGFDNLVKTFPTTNTVAQPFPINKLGDIVRRECATSGWVEVLPLILCSHDENFAWLNRKDDGSTAVVLANPKTAEYQIVRTSLLPGLLKSVRENRKHSLPLRVFEVSDVVLKDAKEDRRARNVRHVAAVFVGRRGGFEVVHGLLDRLMVTLGVRRLSKDSKSDQAGYYIVEHDDPTFFPGRAAQIYYRPSTSAAGQNQLMNTSYEPVPDPLPNPEVVAKSASSASAEDSIAAKVKGAVKSVFTSSSSDIKIGSLGILHPEVLTAFEIDGNPASALEFNLEPFL